MRLPILFVPAVLLGAALTLSAPARADFRACNNTASRVSLALAHTDGSAWVSEGWWNLKANTCETFLRGALAAEFYYVYGIDESGGEWKGKAFMCTRDREFRIDGRQDCFVRGFDRTGFFEIDTGKDAKDWTVQLTEPAKPGAATTGQSLLNPMQPAPSQLGTTQPPPAVPAAVTPSAPATTPNPVAPAATVPATTPPQPAP